MDVFFTYFIYFILQYLLVFLYSNILQCYVIHTVFYVRTVKRHSYVLCCSQFYFYEVWNMLVPATSHQRRAFTLAEATDAVGWALE